MLLECMLWALPLDLPGIMPHCAQSLNVHAFPSCIIMLHLGHSKKC
jgi:hypothetical protein